MNITTRMSLMGFLLALSALNIAAATAAPSTIPAQSPAQSSEQPTVEGRLARLTAAIRERETQLPESLKTNPDLRLAIGWADGSRGNQWANGARGRGTATGAGGSTWTNGRYGGGASGANGGSWGNVHSPGWSGGSGGTFVNATPWRNAWADGGGFYNYPGRFVNY